MNRHTAFTIALAMTAILAAPPAADAARERPIRLTMSTQYMDRHSVVQKVFKPWIEEIRKRTDGRVIITYYNPNTLCPDGELLDAVVKGQVDIGEHINSRIPGRLPLNTVTNKVPMVSSSSMSGSMAYWNLYNAVPEMQDEFRGMKILAVHVTSPLQIHTRDGFVTSLSDLRGKRIIGASKDTMLVFSALGLSGIMQPSPDIYLAMSRNMGDAVFFPIPPMRSFKINEATTHSTLFDGYTGACWIGMNQAKWDSLPPDIQKIFEETTGEAMTRAIATALDQGEREDMEIMKKEGQQFSELPAEERARWRALLEPAMKSAWMEEAGHSGMQDREGLFRKAEEIMSRCEAKYGRAARAETAVQ